DVPYFYFNPDNNSSNIPYIQSKTPIYFEEGETYLLSFDWQTFAVRAVDHVWIIATESETANNVSIVTGDTYLDGNNFRTYWGAEYNRVWIKFSPIRSMEGYVRIGTNLTNNEHGRRPFKIRLPYLTTTDNTRWLYHQLDQAQNLEEITRRVM